MEKSYESLIYSLDSAAWYEGLSQIIHDWQYLPVDGTNIWCPLSAPINSEYSEHDWALLDFVWMLCVELFGDYGTSPRFGWITQVDEFKEFCNQFSTESPELSLGPLLIQINKE